MAEIVMAELPRQTAEMKTDWGMWEKVVSRTRRLVPARQSVAEVSEVVGENKARLQNYNERITDLILWLTDGYSGEGWIVPGIPVQESGLINEIARWQLDTEDEQVIRKGRGILLTDYALNLSRRLIEDGMTVDWDIEEKEWLWGYEAWLTSLSEQMKNDLRSGDVGVYPLKEIKEDFLWIKQRVGGVGASSRVIGAELWGLETDQLAWLNEQIQSMVDEVMTGVDLSPKIILFPVESWLDVETGAALAGLAGIESGRIFFRLPLRERKLNDSIQLFRHFLYHEVAHFREEVLGLGDKKRLMRMMADDAWDLWRGGISSYEKKVLSEMSPLDRNIEKRTEAIALYFSNPEGLRLKHPETYKAVEVLYKK